MFWPIAGARWVWTFLPRCFRNAINRVQADRKFELFLTSPKNNVFSQEYRCSVYQKFGLFGNGSFLLSFNGPMSPLA